MNEWESVETGVVDRLVSGGCGWLCGLWLCEYERCGGCWELELGQGPRGGVVVSLRLRILGTPHGQRHLGGVYRESWPGTFPHSRRLAAGSSAGSPCKNKFIYCSRSHASHTIGE